MRLVCAHPFLFVPRCLFAAALPLVLPNLENKRDDLFSPLFFFPYARVRVALSLYWSFFSLGCCGRESPAFFRGVDHVYPPMRAPIPTRGLLPLSPFGELFFFLLCALLVA